MARRSIFQRLKTGSKLKQRSMYQKKNVAEQQQQPATTIVQHLDENLQTIKALLGDPADLVMRELLIGGIEKRAAIVYISGITKEEFINNNILKTVQLNLKQFETDILNRIKDEVIAITDVNQTNILEDVAFAILTGNAALYIEGEEDVLLMETIGGETRAIQEPEAETLIRGPRDGFIESITVNMALLRRDIKDQNLRFKQHVVGRRSKKSLVVCYVEGLTNPDLVDEVNRRLESIDIDYLSDSAIVEQWIEDSMFSPFPQIQDTERPDIVSAALMAGKVGIIVDGTPSALVAPMTFGDGLDSPEDYNQRWMSASALRTLRYVAAFIAVFLPGLYVALVAYHPGMIPSSLAYSIAASREGIPFPSVLEAVLMALTFELLHEAGIRLPNVIGQTIGIVGGLVIGEAAVSAGIVSPTMVIVTALTAIASFSIPAYSMSIAFRTLRFLVLLAGGLLGLYGIILIYIMINIHMVNLKSLGVPFAAPFGPMFLKDLKDVVIRAPITKLALRPEHLKPLDPTSKNLAGATPKNKKS